MKALTPATPWLGKGNPGPPEVSTQFKTNLKTWTIQWKPTGISRSIIGAFAG